MHGVATRRKRVEVSVQDFADFFAEKRQGAGAYSCPVCGSQHFVVALNHQQGPAQLTLNILPPPGVVIQQHHSYFSMSCTNCGRAEFFHTGVVTQWKQWRPAPVAY
jgi:predicted nucleic-acid-binding Zn-ribbon protein